MSDLDPILKESFGMPLAWIYTPAGDILRDYDEQPISKYLTEFEYEYNEEDDDVCVMKFEFPSLKSFDLPYFQQDVILVVQWGYILPNGQSLKGPKRKIAIRDLESNYKVDGIELELQCTDLVSYLKGFKLKTINNYSGKSAQEIAEVENNLDNLTGFIHEVGKGQFKTTFTTENQAMRIDQLGNQRMANYDAKTNTYSSAIDNNLVKKTFIEGFKMEKITKGKSMSITNAIRQKLAMLNAKAKVGNPYIMDGTDDNIEIRNRNFSQNIYKSYTYAGGSGELLSFKSSTKTRKEKKDIAVSSGINPYTKEVESNQVATAEAKTKGDIPFKRPEQMTQAEKEEAKKTIKNALTVDTNKTPKKETLERWIEEDWAKAFEHNVNNPLNQISVPALRYSYTKYTGESYMGQGGKKDVVVTIPTQEVYNMPLFQSILAEKIANTKSKIRRERVLTSQTIEMVQRKYEAEVEVIGDPSLIKAKIIYINNLGRLDRGSWYVTSCKHSIRMKDSYICEMSVIKKPSTIGISAKRYASNPKFDRKANTVEFVKAPIETENTFLFDEEEPTTATNVSGMDTNYNNVSREEKQVQMQARLNDLKAEEDFKYGEEPISNPNYPSSNITDKPNNDKY